MKLKLHKLIWCLQIVACTLTTAQAMAQTPDKIIDSLRRKAHHQPPEQYINTCFTIADNFMELDLYDSAQLWLNRIAGTLPLKQPSIPSYFLSSRQAEVYYYNGLQQLGLEESQRMLSLAQLLKDSILTADSYNFLGLFCINADSLQQAVHYLKEGIHFTRQPPYSDNYLSLSLPHHLYGNLAEAYEKLSKYDSAVYYSRISLQLSAAINAERGVAIAHNNIAYGFLKKENADSAFHHYNKSLELATRTEQYDVELINCAGLAMTHHLLHDKQATLNWLKKGFDLIGWQPFVNNLFKGMFLTNAINLYEKLNEANLLTHALKQKEKLLQEQIARSNRQINIIMDAGLQNETRLLNLQVKEAEQRNEIVTTRVYLLAALLIVLMAAFLLYRYKLGHRLRVIELQNKISQDLHDDVGSSLSSLQVYSAVADRLMEKEPAKAKEMLRKIATESATVMENIGDIVWSMKTGSQQGLDERVKNFVADVLGAANIQYTIFVEDGIEESIRNVEAKRNILLIIKEAVNNVVRYSKASNAAISIKRLAGQVCVQIADDGIGFNRETARNKGNGLFNMQKRTIELDGVYEIISSPGRGTTVSALFPPTKISDSA